MHPTLSASACSALCDNNLSYCALLFYGPAIQLFVLSIFSSEYNAFWRCVQAGATYLFVQLCKVSELSGYKRIIIWKVPEIKNCAGGKT